MLARGPYRAYTASNTNVPEDVMIGMILLLLCLSTLLVFLLPDDRPLIDD